MRFLFVLIWITIPCMLRAQEKKFLHKELAFTTDNDAFLLQKKDAYYTNGVYIQYRFADTHTVRKKIHAFEIGQMIFTPLDGSVNSFTLTKGFSSRYSAIALMSFSRITSSVSFASIQDTILTEASNRAKRNDGLIFMG